ncbi:MAG: Fe-S cluster protein [Desulfobacterota bacterium]|nr:Fe-S cluster protein [Thermodesulfobacteriota bacterium]
MQQATVTLPQLDCGLCGFRTCAEMESRMADDPGIIKRCIHLSENRIVAKRTDSGSCSTCTATCDGMFAVSDEVTWKDSLGRDFDFYLEHFPEDPGPREIILPHNPMITRELNVAVGDILIGRPLGMSCGCPITHCGIAMEVDMRTGVIVWCVTGPLKPREQGYKDLGYYIAEGYEGIITKTRKEIKIGMRYFFQPRMCMLQWRHSGLVNYMNRTREGWQVRLEGLWIG